MALALPDRLRQCRESPPGACCFTPEKQIALRAGLGASRGRIVRQPLTESGAPVGAGGGAGLLPACGNACTGCFEPPELLDLAQARISLPCACLHSGGIALLTGITLGSFPRLRRRALRSAGIPSGEGGTYRGSVRSHRFRTFCRRQAALALVLLVGAGLAGLKRVQPFASRQSRYLTPGTWR